MAGNPFHVACWSLLVGTGVVGLAALSQIDLMRTLPLIAQHANFDHPESTVNVAGLAASYDHRPVFGSRTRSRAESIRTSSTDLRFAASAPVSVDAGLRPTELSAPHSRRHRTPFESRAHQTRLDRVVPPPADVNELAMHDMQEAWRFQPSDPTMQTADWDLLDARIDGLRDAHGHLATEIDEITHVVDQLRTSREEIAPVEPTPSSIGLGSMRR